MRSADQYRKLAAELKAKAAKEQDQSFASELDGIAVGPKYRLDDDLPERH